MESSAEAPDREVTAGPRKQPASLRRSSRVLILLLVLALLVALPSFLPGSWWAGALLPAAAFGAVLWLFRVRPRAAWLAAGSLLFLAPLWLKPVVGISPVASLLLLGPIWGLVLLAIPCWLLLAAARRGRSREDPIEKRR